VGPRSWLRERGRLSGVRWHGALDDQAVGSEAAPEADPSDDHQREII
jgi:hypothetical protein